MLDSDADGRRTSDISSGLDSGDALGPDRGPRGAVRDGALATLSYRSTDRPNRYNAKDIFLYTKQKVEIYECLIGYQSGVLF